MLNRRQRAGAIVIDGDRVLVAGMTHPTAGRWYSFPGGGRDEGETVEDAVVRELYEEAGLRGVCGPHFAHVWTGTYEHHYHLVHCADLELGAVTGPELDYMPPEAAFAVEWLPIERLASERMWPRVVAEQVAAYAAGAPIPSPVPEIEAPPGWVEVSEGELPPSTVFAVVVVGDRLALVRRRDGGWRLPRAEPGPDETVADAAGRAVRSELGITPRVGATLALASWRQTFQSYVWCEVEGAAPESVAVDRLASVDVRPGWLPELLPGWIADPNPARADRFHDEG
ncbi:MAG TPA: NUDIX domain-containing protein [Acidimicrobiales bacterium]|nr:NUDIX domain-containing protein [Acidimicrobiales bacterium]